MIEHEADENDGDVETETRALGAVYFVRGETGYFSRNAGGNPDPVYHIASDFVQLFEAFAFQGDKLGDIDKPHEDPYGMIEDFEAIVDAGIKNARDEHRDNDEDGLLPEFAAARAWFVWLMIDGYTAACERFDGKGFRALELFDAISKCTDSALDYARDAAEFGYLELTIDTAAAKFSARFYTEQYPTWGDLTPETNEND